MARGFLKWSVKDLAERSGVAESTIKRMEIVDGEPSARPENMEAIFQALRAAGIELIPENGGGAGVRTRKAKTLGKRR
jgi:transcriptional regulator with XRE-family HTH domain